MRITFTLLLTLIVSFVFSQAPRLINYQGVIRNAAGDPIANSNVAIRFELRQGTANGPVVFTETQSVSTGTLGVFSTQIGQTNSLSVNWKSGPFFLAIAVDLDNGTNFTVLGTQQLLSVPYAQFANGVPASYTNNVLSIGDETIALQSYTAGNGIAIQSGSIIANTLPDQTVAIDPGNTNVNVTGVYPNFSVSATPSLVLLSPHTLSITEGNSVTIAPQLDFTNNILTVGPASNTVAIPVPPTTSLVGSGAVSVATLGTNSYSVNVDPVTITQGSNVTVAGTYPNFVISSTPTLSFLSPNTLSISNGNSVSLPQTTLVPSGGGISVTSPGTNSFNVVVPSPTLNNGSNVSVAGIHPNFTVNATPSLSLLGPNSMSISFGNSVAISPSLNFTNNVLTVGPSGNTVTIPSSTTSIVGTGLAGVTVLAPNSYSINVPVPVFSNGTNVQFTGIYPNYVVNSTPTLALNNNSLSISGNPTTLTLNNYTVGSGLVMSGGPNYTISSTAQTPSIAGQGAALVNPSSGNSFTVNVPQTLITSTSGIATVGTSGTNTFNVNVPAPSYNAATGALTQGTSTTNITQTLNLSGNVLTVGPSANTVTLPQPAVTATTGIATINTAGTNSFNVNVPAASYNQSTGALTQGTAVANITQTLGFSNNVLTVGPGTNTIAIPPTTNTITGAGIVTVNPASGNNFVVDVATPTFTGTGITSVTGTYPNYTVNTPATTATITGSGAASVSPSTGLNFNVNVPQTQLTSTSGIALVNATGTNSFNINVPAPSYNPATGILTQGTVTNNILPALGFSNNVLSSGLPSNSVSIPSPSITGIGAASVTASGNTYTVDVPVLNLNATGGSSISGVFPNYTVVTQTTSIVPGGAVSVNGVFPNYTVSAPGTSVSGTGLANVTTSGAGTFVVDVPALTYTPSTGVLASGTNTVSVLSPLTFTNNILSSGPASNSVNLVASPFVQSAGNVTLVAPASSVGIGTSSPNSALHLVGTSNGTNSQLINSVFSTSTAASAANLTSGRFFTNYNTSGSPQFLTAVNGHLNLGSGSNSSQYPAGGWFNTNALSGTHLNAIGVLGTIENSGAGTITNAYGGYFDHLASANVTNGYGLYTGSISGTNKWSVYASDATARNFFAGRVGIGNNNPIEHLQIESSDQTQMSLIAPTTSAAVVSFGTSTNHNLGQLRYENSNNTFNLWANNTPNRMSLDANGHMGLNSLPSAAYNLNIFGGGTGSSIRLNNASSLSLGFVIEANSAAASINNYENTALHFGTSGFTRVTIGSSGNVGIGTVSPSARLQIDVTNATSNFYDMASALGTVLVGEYRGKSGIAPQWRYQTAPSTNFIDIGQNTNGDFVIEGNDVARMVVTNGGNVGVGTSAPTANLHVAGTTRFVDGNQGVGKVLTSDATGGATWQQVLPSGMVMAYAGTSVPAGWLLCDGSTVSRAAFANLFAAIGTSWGQGDGSTTFHLPDMRGMFLRGVSGTSGNDPDAAGRGPVNSGGNTGNNVGSEQDDEFAQHSHTFGASTLLGGLIGASVYTNGGTTSTSVAGGSTETRPKNVYVYYIIKQ